MKGKAFLTKIDSLSKRKGMKTKDSLFKVLDCIFLKPGCHLALKLAKEQGMGDESVFYCYKGERDINKDDPYILSYSTFGRNY